MARFQVVAVYPSGSRFQVREPHASFAGALWHRSVCERSADVRDTWVYEVDMTYVGVDGQQHWRGNVQPEDLGYTADELEAAV